jgi:hypothetical protein
MVDGMGEGPFETTQEPSKPERREVPVVCTSGHQFDASESPNGKGIKCPECGAPVMETAAVKQEVDPALLAEVTMDSEQWWDACASIEACFRWQGIAAEIALIENISWGLAVARWLHWFETAFIPPPPPAEHKTVVVKVRRRMALSEPERASYADEMAELSGKITSAKNRKKAAMEAFKEEIDGLAGQLSDIAMRIRQGDERDVDVEIESNYRNNTYRRTVVETGEIIEERALTPEERQEQLMLDPRKPDPPKPKRKKSAPVASLKGRKPKPKGKR